jgi:hypothetical protein
MVALRQTIVSLLVLDLPQVVMQACVVYLLLLLLLSPSLSRARGVGAGPDHPYVR